MFIPQVRRTRASRGRPYCRCALASACAGFLFLSTTQASIIVKGAGCKNGNCTGVKDMKLDQGADVTLISRACAAKMGLLGDADGDGTPDLASGSKNFNSGTIETWCFPAVAIGAVSTTKQTCVNSTTVYVSKKADHWGGRDLLGLPWQKRVDACFRAKTESATWPWQVPADAEAKEQVPKEDSSGETKTVNEDVTVVGTSGGAVLDMVVIPGAEYSVIPASIAAAIGATPVGLIDLALDNPDFLGELRFASMDLTNQSVFEVVEIQDYNLGVGIAGGSVLVLVSDDANSLFGIIGNNMLTQNLPPDLPFEYILAPAAGPAGTLFFGTVDCDGNGVPDVLEILKDPSLDQNGNGELDACEDPIGAICLTDGSCFEGPLPFADFIGADFLGFSSTCDESPCPDDVCDVDRAVLIIDGALFIVGDTVTDSEQTMGAVDGVDVMLDNTFALTDDSFFLADTAQQIAEACGECGIEAVFELARAKEKLDGARDQINQAKQQIQDARQELMDAMTQLADAQGQIDQAKVQLILDPPDTQRAKEKIEAVRVLHARVKEKNAAVRTAIQRIKDKIVRIKQKHQGVRQQIASGVTSLVECGPCGDEAIALMQIADNNMEVAIQVDDNALQGMSFAEAAAESGEGNAGDLVELETAIINLLSGCTSCPGDINGDGIVDVTDVLLVLGNWGGPGGDANGDGTTDVTDLLLVLANWRAC